MGSEAHEKLVEAVGRFPTAEWIDEFLDLLNDLLSKVDLREDDPRLVTSVRGDRLAVTMNSRYVLVAFFAEPSVAFVVRNGSEHADKVIEEADIHSTFNALQGEHEDETPHYVEFEASPKSAIDESIHPNWLQAAAIEFDRWQGSPYKRYHEPLVAKAALDEEYRSRLLEEAFE